MSKYASESTNELSAALSLAQGAYLALKQNRQAPGGSYADLMAILDAVKDALSKNSLSFYQYTELTDEGSGASLLWSVISHGSGQFIKSCWRVVQFQTFRETSNGIESYKRLNACMLLGIAPSPNDPLLFDDNGTEESERQILKDIRAPGSTIKSDHVDTITKDQYEDLNHELEGFEQIARGILKFYGINALSDIPKTEFYNVQNKIRRIKKTHEDSLKK